MFPACLTSLASSCDAAHVNGVVLASNFAGTQLPAAKLRLAAERSNRFVQGKKHAASIRCSAEASISIKEKLRSLILKDDGKQTVTGTVRIQKESVMDLGSHALSELLGQKVKLRLVSLDIDPGTKEGKRSPESYLKIWVSDRPDDEADEDAYLSVQFSLPKDFGTPGAFLIESQHSNEFFLKSLTLQMPDDSEIYFSCNSWINHSKTYPGPRTFFANQVYLPDQTPPGLAKLREDELTYLRGDGTGERKKGERIYDYDVYNDLGNPDKDKKYTRPVLGGSKDRPYPRRCRTGRKHTKSDPASEVPAENYVPRDDEFSDKKYRQFVAAGLRCFGHDILPFLEALVERGRHFDEMDEIHDLYTEDVLVKPTSSIPSEDPRDGTVFQFPRPPLIRATREAWTSDQEFARQKLAGLNPMVIERLKVFPPVSSLDPEIYGPPESSITAHHIEPNLQGLTAEQALKQNRLFTVDYHDAYLPYLEKINALDAKAYASRTIHFLTREGFLMPVAIELSLPPKKKGEKCVSRVFTPPLRGESGWLWRLAKTHAAINDSGYHQLCSHWLRTHACVEPFIIAAHRQLSALHPLYLLLSSHFKDTMKINAMARQALINSDGIIERSFTPGKYSMELSSVVYKSWRFDEQALPKDLIKRGMAEKDAEGKHGLRLIIEDYPYAADGLDLWATIQGWVREYVGIYYKDDKTVEEDSELQSWWKEVREVGHGDHKDGDGWVEMKKVEELEEVLVTLIWLTSGHHAAVNFGQYAYSGFMPNRPTMGYRLIPEEGTKEYKEFFENPEKFFLRSVATEGQSTLVMATVEVLSQHMEEEEYMGQRSDPKWISEERVVAAFERFGEALAQVEEGIHARNAQHQLLQHRSGPAKVPYTLLVPSSTQGLTLRGVPNSISI